MSSKRILLCSLCALVCLSLPARKKPLDHSVYDAWERVMDVSLTPDGAYLGYRVAVQQGDGRLLIRRTADGAQLSIPRGEALRMDGKRAYCNIKPPYAAVRAAKIKKVKKDKMPQDSLAVIDLSTMQLSKFPGMKRFKTGFDAMPFVAYETKDAVVVLNPAEGNRADTIKQASAFTFSRDGRLLALVLKKDKKDSLSQNAMLLYNPADGKRTVLDSGKAFYGGPALRPDALGQGKRCAYAGGRFFPCRQELVFYRTQRPLLLAFRKADFRRDGTLQSAQGYEHRGIRAGATGNLELGCPLYPADAPKGRSREKDVSGGDRRRAR